MQYVVAYTFLESSICTFCAPAIGNCTLRKDARIKDGVNYVGDIIRPPCSCPVSGNLTFRPVSMDPDYYGNGYLHTSTVILSHNLKQLQQKQTQQFLIPYHVLIARKKVLRNPRGGSV